MKVMRDDDGEFVHNGHLLGFFRRICRLLFNKIRPVFVFDGATPVLKKLTVAARRQRRETQGAQVCIARGATPPAPQPRMSTHNTCHDASREIVQAGYVVHMHARATLTNT